MSWSTLGAMSASRKSARQADRGKERIKFQFAPKRATSLSPAVLLLSPTTKSSTGCSYSPQLVQILAPFSTRFTYYSGTQWEIWSLLIGGAVDDEPFRPNDQVYLIPDIHLLQSSSHICEMPARTLQLFSISLLVESSPVATIYVE